MLDCMSIMAVASTDYSSKANYEKVVTNYESAPKYAYMNAEIKIKKDGVKIVYLNEEKTV